MNWGRKVPPANEYILTYKESKWYKSAQRDKNSNLEYTTISPEIEFDPSSLPKRLLLTSITDFSISYIIDIFPIANSISDVLLEYFSQKYSQWQCG